MRKGYPRESSNPAGPFSQTATCPLVFGLACQRSCFGYLLLSCGPSEQEYHLLCHDFPGSPACSSSLHLEPASVLSKQCLVDGIPGEGCCPVLLGTTTQAGRMPEPVGKDGRENCNSEKG